MKAENLDLKDWVTAIFRDIPLISIVSQLPYELRRRIYDRVYNNKDERFVDDITTWGPICSQMWAPVVFYLLNIVTKNTSIVSAAVGYFMLDNAYRYAYWIQNTNRGNPGETTGTILVDAPYKKFNSNK